MRTFWALFGLFVSVEATRSNIDVSSLSPDGKSQEKKTKSVLPSTKKGLGLTEKLGRGVKQLESTGAAWFYNWGLTTEAKDDRFAYVPMVFGTKETPPTDKVSFILGFNEPDNEKQSNITVKDAIAAWPKVVAAANFVVSPAMSHNPLETWMPVFMTDAPKVDALAVHWYKEPNSEKFKGDMTLIYNTYKKPIWVTEFAPQTVAEAEEKPTKYTQEQVNTFIKEAVAFMESTDWIQRYAWHDARKGTSALFDSLGSLTPTGEAYAAAAGVATVGEEKSGSSKDSTALALFFVAVSTFAGVGRM